LPGELALIVTPGLLPGDRWISPGSRGFTMRSRLRTVTLAGALAIGGLLAIGAPEAKAQLFLGGGRGFSLNIGIGNPYYGGFGSPGYGFGSPGYGSPGFLGTGFGYPRYGFGTGYGFGYPRYGFSSLGFGLSSVGYSSPYAYAGGGYPGYGYGYGYGYPVAGYRSYSSGYYGYSGYGGGYYGGYPGYRGW